MQNEMDCLKHAYFVKFDRYIVIIIFIFFLSVIITGMFL